MPFSKKNILVFAGLLIVSLWKKYRSKLDKFFSLAFSDDCFALSFFWIIFWKDIIIETRKIGVNGCRISWYSREHFEVIDQTCLARQKALALHKKPVMIKLIHLQRPNDRASNYNSSIFLLNVINKCFKVKQVENSIKSVWPFESRRCRKSGKNDKKFSFIFFIFSPYTGNTLREKEKFIFLLSLNRTPCDKIF